MPPPVDVDDVELDPDAAAARRPGIIERIRRRLARGLRSGADRLRRGRNRS
jgi:hypothetical protein|tara:strand:+ start:809 stop:961 length:153 start_codon:yes stop_codon:yes gene_type:complete